MNQRKGHSKEAVNVTGIIPEKKVTHPHKRRSFLLNTCRKFFDNIYSYLNFVIVQFLFLHWWRRKNREKSYITKTGLRKGRSNKYYTSSLLVYIHILTKILFPVTLLLSVCSVLFDTVKGLLSIVVFHLFNIFSRVFFTHQNIRFLYSALFDFWNQEHLDKEQLLFHGRKTLVLDLDETLVHSTTRQDSSFDIRLEVPVDNYPSIFYVNKRPYLDTFLQVASQWYNLVIYTASMEKYANPLIDALDVHGVIRERYFREHCIQVGNNFIKDISIIEPDLRKIVIVDNSPAAYALHEDNAIPIGTWWDDKEDDELLNLLPFLQALCVLADVRSILSLRQTEGVLLHNLMSRQAAEPFVNDKSSDDKPIEQNTSTLLYTWFTFFDLSYGSFYGLAYVMEGRVQVKEARDRMEGFPE
eukprot:jgi/Galph1/2745/GphlegSOOS_G1389.1